jgi:hypothetical protein
MGWILAHRGVLRIVLVAIAVIVLIFLKDLIFEKIGFGLFILS